MSESRHHAPQRKLLLLRLVHRRRQAAPQSTQDRTRSAAPSKPHAPQQRQPSAGRTVGQAVASIVATANLAPGSARQRVAQALIAATPDTPLAQIGAPHVERTRQAWAHLADWTRHNRDRALRWFLAELERQGAPPIADTMRGAPSPAARQTTPTSQELAALRDCPNLPLRWMILAGSEAGLRSGAAFRCTLRNCTDGVIKARTKFGKVTSIPISKRIAALLATINPKTPPDTTVVDALEGRADTTQKCLGRRWWEWKRRCKITRDLRLHDLRRGFARAVYASTGDLRQVQAALSHANLTATIWYLDAQVPALDPESVTAAVAVQDDQEEHA